VTLGGISCPSLRGPWISGVAGFGAGAEVSRLDITAMVFLALNLSSTSTAVRGKTVDPKKETAPGSSTDRRPEGFPFPESGQNMLRISHLIIGKNP
jgi:hypothetical protein